MQNMFLDKNGIKLEIIKRKNVGKIPLYLGIKQHTFK